MKFFCILFGVVAACWFGYGAFDRMIHPPNKTAPKLAAAVPGAAVPGDGVGLPPLPVSVNNLPPPLDPNSGLKVPQAQTVMVYTFKNRPVPAAPFGRNSAGVGGGPDQNGLELSLDIGSNSWIMRGPPMEVQEIARIAEFLDQTQDEVDLDFLLVTVSESWLRAFGITAAYQEGASWLPGFTLGEGVSGLRISAGEFSVDLNASVADSSASVYSSPVVRVVTGEKWAFGSDKEIPIASVTRQDGVQQSSFEYRSVGLGFTGTLSKAGPSNAYRLALEQRNGDVDTSATPGPGMPPVIRSQLLQTSLVVEVGKWSCVGGVSSWRKEKKRRLLGVSDSEEQNLLLVFVRARDGLTIPPRAHLVRDGLEHLDPLAPDAWDLGPSDSMLLPPPKWLDDEIELVEKKIKARAAVSRGPRGK